MQSAILYLLERGADMKNKIEGFIQHHGFIGDRDAVAMGIGSKAFYRIMENLIPGMRFRWERLADGSTRFNYQGGR